MRWAVAVAVVMLTAACSDDGAPTHDLLAEFVPVDAEPANNEIYLLPADRDRVRTAQVGEVSTTPEDAGSVVTLGRPHDGGVDDLVFVLLTSQDEERDVPESEEFETVDIGTTSARLSSSALGSTVEWFDDGVTVVIFGPAADPDLTVEVARSVDPGQTGADIVSRPPSDLTVLDAATTAGGEWSDLSFTVLMEQRVLSGSVPIPGLSPLYQLVVGADTLTWIDIRGGRGAWSSRPIPRLDEYDYPDDLTEDELTQHTLAWLERPDLVVRLSGSGPIEDLLALAESLEVVHRVEFDSFEELHAFLEPEPAD